jgi:diguanylate cyclase (GGDEF)-like protein
MSVLLSPDGPTLAVLDWMMPGADGLDVCRAVRQQSTSYVYIVLLTANSSRDDRLSALEAGIDDFLTKPIDIVELHARLRSGVRVIEWQNRALDAQQRLARLASHDDLTGLLNRRAILARLEEELGRARRLGSHVGVALADLDHFKKINDTHGHEAGDEVLRLAGEQMTRVLRGSDVVGRYGGEEFLIVTSEPSERGAWHVAEAVRSRIAEQAICIDSGRLPITVSVGAAWSLTVGRDSAALIHAADVALYEAKRLGRDRVVEATPVAVASTAASQV